MVRCWCVPSSRLAGDHVKERGIERIVNASDLRRGDGRGVGEVDRAVLGDGHVLAPHDSFCWLLSQQSKVDLTWRAYIGKVDVPALSIVRQDGDHFAGRVDVQQTWQVRTRRLAFMCAFCLIKGWVEGKPLRASATMRSPFLSNSKPSGRPLTLAQCSVFSSEDCQYY